MPVPLALFALLCGLLLRRVGRRQAGRRVIVGAGVFILLASWWPVAEGLLAPLENRHPALLDPAALEVVAVVVLGGGWRPNPERPITAQLNQNSAIRLFEGLRLLQALPAARLVLTGGSLSADRGPTAQGYAQAARDMGIAPERILTLDTPLNTAQEAYAVRDALTAGRIGLAPIDAAPVQQAPVGGPSLAEVPAHDAPVGTSSVALLKRPQRLVLVTTAAHMPRAMQHFQAVGLDPIPAPTHYMTGRERHTSLLSWLPSSSDLAKTERAWHEYLGLLAWRWDHPG